MEVEKKGGGSEGCSGGSCAVRREREDCFCGRDDREGYGVQEERKSKRWKENRQQRMAGECERGGDCLGDIRRKGRCLWWDEKGKDEMTMLKEE